MKFAKRLEQEAQAEWRSQYVNYKALKKALKGAEDARAAMQGGGRPGRSSALLASSILFVQLLDGELDKVCRFITETQWRLHQSRVFIDDARAPGPTAEGDGERLDLVQLEHDAWMVASQLRAYAELNYVAFYKACKKHDKTTAFRLLPALMRVVDGSVVGRAAHGRPDSFSGGDAGSQQAGAALEHLRIIVAGADGAEEPFVQTAPLLAAVGYPAAGFTEADVPRLVEAATRGEGEDVDGFEASDSDGRRSTADEEERGGDLTPPVRTKSSRGLAAGPGPWVPGQVRASLSMSGFPTSVLPVIDEVGEATANSAEAQQEKSDGLTLDTILAPSPPATPARSVRRSSLTLRADDNHLAAAEALVLATADMDEPLGLPLEDSTAVGLLALLRERTATKATDGSEPSGRSATESDSDGKSSPMRRNTASFLGRISETLPPLSVAFDEATRGGTAGPAAEDERPDHSAEIADFDTCLMDLWRASETALIAACPELEGSSDLNVRERLKRMGHFTLGLLHAHKSVAAKAVYPTTTALILGNVILAEKLTLQRLQLKLLSAALEQTSPEGAGALDLCLAAQYDLLAPYLSSRLKAPTQSRLALVRSLRARGSAVLTPLAATSSASQGSRLPANDADSSSPSSSAAEGRRRSAQFPRRNASAAGVGLVGSTRATRGRLDTQTSDYDSSPGSESESEAQEVKPTMSQVATDALKASRMRKSRSSGSVLTRSEQRPRESPVPDSAKQRYMMHSKRSQEAARALGLESVLRVAESDKALEALAPIAELPPPATVHPSRAQLLITAAAGAAADLSEAFGITTGEKDGRPRPLLAVFAQALDLTQNAQTLHATGDIDTHPRSEIWKIRVSELPSLLWRRFRPPVLDWLPTDYRPSKALSKDVLAGVTIGVMLVPQGLACASLAQLPPQYGLWTGMLPAALYFVLGTSHHAAIGPMSVPALLLSAGVASLQPATPEEHARLILTASFMSGVMMFVMGWTGTGFLTRFISRPVLSGFQSAAAVLTMVSVSKDMLGVRIPSASVLQEMVKGLFSATGLGATNPASLFTALAALLVLIGAPRVPALKVIPTALLTVTVFVAIFAFLAGVGVSHSVMLVGVIPSGWPVPSLPVPLNAAELAALAPVAASVGLVGLLEHLAVSSSYALKHGYEWSINSELKALGVGNMAGAAACGSMFTAGAFGRSAVFDDTGGKSQVGQLVSAATVVILQLAVLPALAYLPKPVLASIIVMSVSKLIDFNQGVTLWRADPRESLILLVAFLATLFAGVLQGVLFAAGVSLLMFLAQTTRPAVEELGRLVGSVLYQPLGQLGVTAVSGIKILRPLAPLFFANSPVLRDRIISLLNARKDLPPRLKWRALILCLSAVASIDTTAMAGLREVIKAAHEQGVLFLIASANPYVERTLVRGGVMEGLGGERFTARRVHEAVRAILTGRVTRKMLPAAAKAAQAMRGTGGLAAPPPSGSRFVSAVRRFIGARNAHVPLAEDGGGVSSPPAAHGL
jgi:SulP family sulfate permease